MAGVIPSPAGRNVLTIQDLHVSYFARGQEVMAARGVNLTVRAGETLAVVGESGSGKSTIAFSTMRGLDAAGRVMQGSIRFHEEDLQAHPFFALLVKVLPDL